MINMIKNQHKDSRKNLQGKHCRYKKVEGLNMRIYKKNYRIQQGKHNSKRHQNII